MFVRRPEVVGGWLKTLQQPSVDLVGRPKKIVFTTSKSQRSHKYCRKTNWSEVAMFVRRPEVVGGWLKTLQQPSVDLVGRPKKIVVIDFSDVEVEEEM
ncbi:hypothetical protein CTI12_AA011120 [Artemisia annua]|uniref:Uncharacterized protein n=1 Tax=Artemisia annua TaxID=35608 RepID=A0A2U1QML8_ARTAN|nr:hypothetical protein CTI12_AA011120 [Artemisia annua]